MLLKLLLRPRPERLARAQVPRDVAPAYERVRRHIDQPTPAALVHQPRQPRPAILDVPAIAVLTCQCGGVGIYLALQALLPGCSLQFRCDDALVLELDLAHHRRRALVSN